MIIASRRHQHASSGANRPSDVAVTVNFNTEFNLMLVNGILEWFSRDLVPEYCQGLESTAIYTAPPFFVESLCGRWNRNLPRLPLHLHGEAIIPIFWMSNIYIGLYLPKALTLTRHRSYKIFKVLPIVGMNNSVSLLGILNFRLLRVMFLYQLGRGIPLKEGVPYPLQSKVRTPPPFLRWTNLALQISLDVCLPPCPLHCDGEYILKPPRQVQAVIVHRHREEPYRQTQLVALYAALHQALLVHPLLSAVLNTCLTPSLIQKPARSLQIHFERQL